MQYGLRARFVIPVFGLCAVAALGMGCAKAPQCTVSPVEIEELREDVSVLEKDLAGVQERIKHLGEDLAAKQADLEAKKPKPDELRQKLEQLKRGSGRTEKPKPADSKATPPSKEPS